MTCACLYIGCTSSNPGIRAVMDHTYEPYMGTVQTRSPSRVNDEAVCEWKSLLEISDHLPT